MDWLRSCPMCERQPTMYGQEGFRRVRCVCGLSGPSELECANIVYHWNHRKDREGLDMCAMRPVGDMCAGLADLARELPRDSVVVEVGAYAGEGTKILADWFKRVFSIDFWETPAGEEPSSRVEYFTFGLDAAEKEFDSMRLSYPGIYKLKGRDTQFLDVFADRSVDMVYIDADHRYESVKKNIAEWMPKVKIGGWIAGHDYFTDTPGVIQAVDEMFGKPDKTFKDRSWAVVVKAPNPNSEYSKQIEDLLESVLGGEVGKKSLTDTTPCESL